MNEFSYEQIKITFIASLFLIVLFIGFIVFVAVLYNRKQLLYIKEKQLAEVERQNQFLQNELEKQKLIEQERERISHDMHDDLGAGISALKLQAEFLQKKVKDKDLIADVQDLLKTSEEINLSMREMLWSLNSGNDNLHNFVQYSSLYAQNFFRKTGIQIQVIKDEIDNRDISAEQRRNMFLCIKEILNNIYKHSQAKNVILYFSQYEKEFSISVQDDGIGLKDENVHGNGMGNMKMRMTSINGNFLEISSKNGLCIKLVLSF